MGCDYVAGCGVMGQVMGLWGEVWCYGAGREVMGQVTGLTPMTRGHDKEVEPKVFIGRRLGGSLRGVA